MYSVSLKPSFIFLRTV